MGPAMDQEATSSSHQHSNASSPEGSDSKASSRSKANIRVSVACVQCRSKHVKCDATLPACNRCQLEQKPCFYAKSRRGIRDPKKRSLISDKPPLRSTSPLFSSIANAPVTCRAPAPIEHHPPGWSVDFKHQTTPSATSEDELLLDLFFSNFHPCVPCLPPRRWFLQHISSDPDSYHFLHSVIKFCGSLYTQQVPSEDLREAAYSAACASLPFTPQSVQGLVLLSLVAFGDSKMELHSGWASDAATLAIQLGMHRTSFADRTPDPILAESYRRTWWCLVFQDSVRKLSDAGPSLTILDVDYDVDLPCEEWEYESGFIPQPISQSQYDAQVNIGQEPPKASSMALLIEICQIQNELVYPYCTAEDDQTPEMFERADARICTWLRRVPRWKLDLVNPDGMVDMILYQTVALAHINRLRLRQSAPRQGLDLSRYFPLGPASGPDRKGQVIRKFGWTPQPTDIQAANGFCDLFRFPFPAKNLCPMFGLGILRVALTYLDACVFLGLDSTAFREKINMLIQLLTEHGEKWSLSRKIADEIKAVAKEYLTPQRNQSLRSSSLGSEPWTVVTSSLASDAPILVPDFGFDFHDVGQMGDQGWNHMQGNWPSLVNVYPV